MRSRARPTPSSSQSGISKTTARATSSACVDLLDQRASLLELDAQLERSYDRYAFIRNAWIQRREYQVKDGDVEDQSLELEDEFKDDPANAAPEAPEPAPRRPAADSHATAAVDQGEK